METALEATPPNAKFSSLPEWSVLLGCARPHADPRHLFELLRCHPPDWSSLLELANEHGLLPLLTARLADSGEDLVPPAIRQKLRERARAQAVFTLQLTGELFLLLARFAALGIEALV